MVLAPKRFWVIDVEGSGGTPPEIVELAMLELLDLQLSGREMHCLVKPAGPIHPAATRIHGITDDDVSSAPAFEDISDDVLLWLDDAPIIGHNVRVELDAISRATPDWHPKSAIDTLQLAKALRPGLESYGLQKLGIQFGLSEEASQRTGKGHHSALYDATLTALIFIDLLSTVPIEQREKVLRDADVLDPKQATFL